jgi:lysozyme family protein
MQIITNEWLGSLLVKIGAATELNASPKEEPKPVPVPSVPPAPQPRKNTGDTKTPDFVYLWETCKINSEDEKYITSDCKKLLANRSRYDKVSAVTKVPWYVIAVIHELESGADFSTHLHNGDPLSARTRQVPKGRPAAGNPPFTWEESAIDALGYDGAAGIKDWNISATLRFLEQYNGLGYRNKGIYSPYLWSCTNHYTKGKYVADGVWNAEAVSNQIGCAALMKGLGV